MIWSCVEDAYQSPPKTADEVQAQWQEETNWGCTSALVRPHQPGPKRHSQLDRSCNGQIRVEGTDRPVPEHI